MFGHEKTISAFKKLVVSNELGQSYLFFGDPQIGKRLFTSCLANFLETGSWEEPTSTLSDSSFIFPKEGKRTIGIDDIREVRRHLSQSPFRSSHRMVVIDNAELLTSEAQSAMLKIVEEPPSHGLVIFIVSDPSSLFSPLLSRLVKIYFPRFSKSRIAEILERELGLSSAKSKLIADDSFGRIGKAIEAARGETIKSGEDDPLYFIEEKILAARKRGVSENSGVLLALLAKEAELKRFNLNPVLQRKAIVEFTSWNKNS